MRSLSQELRQDRFARVAPFDVDDARTCLVSIAPRHPLATQTRWLQDPGKSLQETGFQGSGSQSCAWSERNGAKALLWLVASCCMAARCASVALWT